MAKQPTLRQEIAELKSLVLGLQAQITAIEIRVGKLESTSAPLPFKKFPPRPIDPRPPWILGVDYPLATPGKDVCGNDDRYPRPQPMWLSGSGDAVPAIYYSRGAN